MPLLPSSKKGLGAKIEGDKQLASPTYALEKLALGAAPSIPEFSLERFIPKVDGKPAILNQGATSSCVAHAFCAGLHIMETRAGLPFVPASRLFAYYNARREAGDRIITDSGTYLRTCASGLRHLGVPDEKHWEFSEFSFLVNMRPGFDAVRYAHPRAGGKYVKIYQRELERIDAIKTALYAGLPVAFGTTVGESFLENTGTPYIKRDSGRIAGGHAMLIIGWETEANEVWFRVLNSWGSTWRDGGLCWMHQDRIASILSDDFHVIYGWNRLQQLIVASTP